MGKLPAGDEFLIFKIIGLVAYFLQIGKLRPQTQSIIRQTHRTKLKMRSPHQLLRSPLLCHKKDSGQD
jgi:hypothetical protein